MDVLTPQTNQLTATQTRPREQHHQQPITRREACSQQREYVLIAGPVGSLLDSRNPMPGLHPQPPDAVLAARLRRQILAVGQLVELAEHLLSGRRHDPPRRPGSPASLRARS